MSFQVGSIVGHLQLKKDQWDASIKKVKDDQRSLSGLVIRNSQQFKQMGRTMTIAGTAIVGTVGLMVNAYGQFDKAMTESLAIMGDVSDETRKKMADVAKTISGETVYSAKELAAAYFFLASAGMDTTQSMTVLGDVARFAQAGTFDLSLATDLLTDAQTALGLSSKDAIENQKNLIRVSDVLVGANTLANASVKQFAESLTNKAAAALKNVNKEVEEGVAVLAAYADKGIKGQVAGQRLTMMFNGLFEATRRNKKEWDAIGISLWDATEQMRHTGDIIADLEVHLGSMTPEMRTAELATLGFNLKTKDSILTLLGSSGKIKKWTEDLKNMGGITKEVSDNQLKTLINQFTILKNKITNAAISIGETLGPALKDTIENLKGTVGQITEWIKTHPKLTEVIAKGAVAIGGLLLVLGPLMMMLPGIIAALPLLAAGFAALVAPIGLVIASIAALAGWTNHVINLAKKRTDAEIDAMVNTARGHAEMWALRKKLIENEIVTVEEWGEIYERHGRSHKRVLVAMAKSPEYAHIREELEKIIEKKKELGKEDTTLTETIAKNSGKVTDLINTMVDEIMRATLEEFEYRVWAAQQTYEERKTLLEAEGADKEAFVTLEEARAAELNEIEKEKTEKLREEVQTRSTMLQAAIDAGFEAEKKARDKIQALHEGYTNSIMELTLSEKDYKLWQLDEWYAAELEKLGASLEAKAALEEAYGLKKKKIDTDIAYSQMSLFEKIGSAAIIALGQSKAGAVAQAIMSTYAGAAKTIEMLGMPWAIPFVALAIAAGFKQVKKIMSVSIPSAAKGAYLTEPTVIEAGHGPMGELVSPIPMMKSVFRETIKETTEGAKVNFNFYAPIISTKELSNRDLDKVAEEFFDRMDAEARRRGYSLNG